MYRSTTNTDQEASAIVLEERAENYKSELLSQGYLTKDTAHSLAELATEESDLSSLQDLVLAVVTKAHEPHAILDAAARYRTYVDGVIDEFAERAADVHIDKENRNAFKHARANRPISADLDSYVDVLLDGEAA